MDGSPRVTAVVGATTAAVGGMTLTQWQAVFGIAASGVGICCTIVALYLQWRWHRRRMRNLESN